MIVICGVILIVFIIFNLFVSFSSFYRKLFPQFSAYFNAPTGLDLMSIGSGPGLFDFNFIHCNRNCRNMCIWPQDFRYDYRLLHNYVDLVKNGGVIFHAISPLSFAQNDYLNSLAYNEKYLSVLPTDLVDVPRWYAFLWRFFPAVIYPKSVIKYCLGISISREYRVKESCSKEEVIKSADKLLNSWLKSNPLLDDFKNPSQSDKFSSFFENNTRYLKEIIQFCLEHGIKYVPIVLPMSGYLKESFSKEFLDSFLFSNLESLNIQYYDFLSDDRFDDISNYINGLFLNYDSRVQFTDELLKLTNCINGSLNNK